MLHPSKHTASLLQNKLANDWKEDNQFLIF